MQIKRFTTPGLAINSYLIYDEESMHGALIDPTRQIEIYLAEAKQAKIEITDIIETHVHADFISGAPELKAALQNKPKIHCSGMGGKEWIPEYADHIVQDGDIVDLGGVRLEAKHTPGHTPEHLIWLGFDEQRSRTVPAIVFTGDLLFVGSVGRPDLLGPELEEGLAKQLYRSLFSDLHALPDFLEIYPTHGSGSPCGNMIGKRETSTIGYEKRCNPWLIPMDFKRWHTQLLQNMPAAPQYFSRMKKLNVKGIKRGESKLPPHLTAEEFNRLAPASCVIDIRNSEAFSKGHYKGSINICFREQFPLWVGSIVAGEASLILVVETSAILPEVIRSLRLIGMDQVVGYCLANDKKADELLLTISPEELKKKAQQLYLLDVRTPCEWSTGHILGAHHLELSRVVRDLQQLPKDQAIAVICRSGARASIVASLLKHKGFLQPMNVRGGMEAWSKANLPVAQVET